MESVGEQMKNPEQLKDAVVEAIKEYSEKISSFDFHTHVNVNNVVRGFFGTNESSKIKVRYDKRYEKEFETVSFDATPIIKFGDLNRAAKGYIFDKATNAITFYVPVGRSFEDDRPGNGYWISFRFAKGDNSDKTKLIQSISELLKTVQVHYDDQNSDIKGDKRKIAEEGLPILQAFREIGNKYKDGRNFSMDDLIKEYEQALTQFKQ